LNPSILKTERPPVTCARSNSYCARRHRPTSPPHPPARAGSFFGTKLPNRDVGSTAATGDKPDMSPTAQFAHSRLPQGKHCFLANEEAVR
jgi:hypothetical protein